MLLSPCLFYSGPQCNKGFWISQGSTDKKRGVFHELGLEACCPLPVAGASSGASPVTSIVWETSPISSFRSRTERLEIRDDEAAAR